MKKLIYSIFFISSSAFSQREVTVANFTKITSFDQIEVFLVKTEGNPKVVLNGAGSEDVEVVEKNFELKIRMPLLKFLKGDNVTATVYYVTPIAQFEANEGSRLASSDEFIGKSLRLIAKEGSEIKLKIITDKLNVRVTNGSSISLSGRAKNQDVITNTGGTYDGSKLKTIQTTIASNTGGNTSINASDFVNATIFAGGIISIHGNPKKTTQKITAGGKIEEVK
jgi:hypothetical protein